MGVLRPVNCGGARRAEESSAADRKTCLELRLEIGCAFVFIELDHFLNCDVLRLAFSSPCSWERISSRDSKRVPSTPGGRSGCRSSSDRQLRLAFSSLFSGW